MNDLTPLLILFAFSNKKGFDSIKSAVKVAEGFADKIGSLQNVMKLMPTLMGSLNESAATEEYVDTLREAIKKIS